MTSEMMFQSKKARTSQGQLPELTRWQAPRRETRSAVAVQDHYQAAAEQMQDDRRRSEHVGFVLPRTVTDRDRTAKIFFDPPVVASGNLSVRIFIILSQAFEDRHFRKFRHFLAPAFEGGELSLGG